MAPDLSYYVQLLQSCNNLSSIHRGSQLHLLFFKKGVLNSALTIGNRLLQLYIKCSRISDAQKLFEEMAERNCFTWNTMIEGYMKSGDIEKSLELFSCTRQKDIFSWNVVISGVIKTGDLGRAKFLFDQMPEKNGIAWNSMIRGYIQHGYTKYALKMFKDLSRDVMEEAWCHDIYVLATVIGACSDLMYLDGGTQIHARIITEELELDSVLGCSLINMYGKCGRLDYAEYVANLMKEPAGDFSLSALITGYANAGRMNDARRIFNKINNPCVVLWNSMMSAYISNKEELEALDLFHMMRGTGVRADFSTFVSVLSACTNTGLLRHGQQLHSHACKVGVLKDVIVSCAFIDMYSKCKCAVDACILFDEVEHHDTILLNAMINVYCNCGRLQEAKHIFDNMPCKTLISWNSMIVGFNQNGCPALSLDLFRQMNMLGIRMDRFSFASVINVCASISSLELGEQVFARATALGLETDPVICTSLIDFYCKCGFIDLGRKLFDGMVEFDEVSWSSMLMGYSTNGRGIEALNLFYDMMQAGLRPTHITFMGILSACNHCGLIDEGRNWFNRMQSEYHIDPWFEHYSCMVDLFARAGSLEEAITLIEQMPFEADVSMWASVLRGCVTHGDKALGKKVAELMMDLDSEDSSACVQLSSVLAYSGDWEGSMEVRNFMRNKHINKCPGMSWADT